MRKQKASSIIDYVMITTIVIATIVMMGSYIKRGLMYKYKETGDSIGHGRLYNGKLNLTGID